MPGTLIIIPTARDMTAKPLSGDPTEVLMEIKQAIGGGYLEVVPGFVTIEHAGEQRRCVAFCDEDGKRKQLPFNSVANVLWVRAVERRGIRLRGDYLVGSIAVVYGDDKFMSSL